MTSPTIAKPVHAPAEAAPSTDPQLPQPVQPPPPPPTTHPIPGFAYLRIPAGHPHSTEDCTFLDVSSTTCPAPAEAEQPTATSSVDALTLRRWLMVWLEAMEGRRAPQSLKKGPYSPAVVDALHRAHAPRTAGSKVGSIQTQTTRSGKIRFAASVYYDGRVRALSGVLDNGKGPRSTQYPPRTRAELRVGLWRVEHLHMV